MNIITTQNFVAGIFSEWQDAQDYLLQKPIEIRGFVHTNSDLQYPFYLLETGGRFVGYQTKIEAPDGGILYLITEDYVPDIPWTDLMGKLPHQHT